MHMTATQREIAMTGLATAWTEGYDVTDQPVSCWLCLALATAWTEGYDVTELKSSQRLAARWNAALWKEALGEEADSQ